uniref:CCM2_C domain-containing protein n=1 Tax=Wuchereria bancrofti TaxID=6293 RepID=A0A1I8EPC0_WUCBA
MKLPWTYSEYAGLIRDIRGDIDPSGRTDLLKILDRAKIRKQIASFDEKSNFTANAVLQIDLSAITIRSIFDNELLLYVPIHLIASVGFVREAHEYILPVKVGYGSTRNCDFFDLAVVYCETADVAEAICNILGQFFSQVYKEVASNFETIALKKKQEKRFQERQPPLQFHLLIIIALYCNLTESHQDLRIGSSHPLCSTTASRSDSTEVYIDDIIEDYMTVLTRSLTTNELSQYAALIMGFRNGSMPIIELAQKSSELYGPERLHLLTGMRCLLRNRSKDEIRSFDGFIEMLRLSGYAHRKDFICILTVTISDIPKKL